MEEESTNQWWEALDACVKGHVARHSDHTVRVEHKDRLRTFTLGTVQLSFALACQTVCVQLSTRRYTKAEVFWAHQPYVHCSNAALLRHVALMCKCMLILDAAMRLEHVDTALARDTPTYEGLVLDLVLCPSSPLLCPKHRLVALVPATGAAIATVTFAERFWTTPRSLPSAPEVAPTPKQTHKHFRTVHTLVDFILKDRRRSTWAGHT
jgi:hypothetical protein